MALKIGSGSYGSVKRATRIQDGVEVAVKIIPKSNVAGHFDMVLGEMNVLKGVDHPNVIHFYDWFESRYLSHLYALLSRVWLTHSH
jgi:calcium/calmodulin-dependent protein kinase I